MTLEDAVNDLLNTNPKDLLDENPWDPSPRMKIISAMMRYHAEEDDFE